MLFVNHNAFFGKATFFLPNSQAFYQILRERKKQESFEVPGESKFCLLVLPARRCFLTNTWASLWFGSSSKTKPITCLYSFNHCITDDFSFSCPPLTIPVFVSVDLLDRGSIVYGSFFVFACSMFETLSNKFQLEAVEGWRISNWLNSAASSELRRSDPWYFQVPPNAQRGAQFFSEVSTKEAKSIPIASYLLTPRPKVHRAMKTRKQTERCGDAISGRLTDLSPLDQARLKLSQAGCSNKVEVFVERSNS